MQLKYATPASSAWRAYSSGATNRNENSIGSVMPVRNDVSAAEAIRPPTFARFSGRAVRHIASAAAGIPEAAQREKTSMPRPIGGQTKLSTIPTTIAANAVRIGTDRLPAKKPRYGGSLSLKYRLKRTAATAPMRMPPKTPVSNDGMPMIGFGS